MEQATQQQVLPGRKSRTLNPAATILISMNMALFVMGGWALASFGSIRGAIGYYLKGETLFLDSTEKSFGTATPGDQVGVTFRLTNRGHQPIRVLGCQASCSCMVPKDLPFILSPSESRDFSLSIQTPPKLPGTQLANSTGMEV